MKNRTGNHGDSYIIDYHFASLLDLLDYIENSQRVTSKKSSENLDKHFTGTESFQQAFEMCKNGYFSKDVENFQNIFFKIANQVARKLKLIKVKHDVVGAVPDVPRYLTGNPLNMLNLENKEKVKKPKTIVLNFNSSTSASTSKSTIEKRGLTFVLLFDLLRKLGSPVKLNLVEFSSSEDFYVNTEVVLMKNKDMINISKIYFPLVHPSYLRRIMFALEERLPELKNRQEYFHGYGCPESYRKYVKMTGTELHENEINIFTDDYEYVSIGNALKKIIADVDKAGGLKSSYEEISNLLDEIDFSTLSEFDDEKDY